MRVGGVVYLDESRSPRAGPIASGIFLVRVVYGGVAQALPAESTVTASLEVCGGVALKASPPHGSPEMPRRPCVAVFFFCLLGHL